MSEVGEGGQPERVVRLMFRYRDGVPELVSRQTVEMVLPEADEAPAADVGAADAGAADIGAAHLVFELRDAHQRPLLARALDDRIPTSHEVFSPEAIGRVEDPQPSGVFEVLVPDLPDAEFGALVAAGASLGAAMDASEVTFRLSDVPEDDDLDDEPGPDGEGDEP
ncbi:MAG TPA: hypothetical protein VHG08_00540 [Longimicrobium sp.]|nr:hypothetical protein [Longimicrobium sp.]